MSSFFDFFLSLTNTVTLKLGNREDTIVRYKKFLRGTYCKNTISLWMLFLSVLPQDDLLEHNGDFCRTNDPIEEISSAKSQCPPESLVTPPKEFTQQHRTG